MCQTMEGCDLSVQCCLEPVKDRFQQRGKILTSDRHRIRHYYGKWNETRQRKGQGCEKN